MSPGKSEADARKPAMIVGAINPIVASNVIKRPGVCQEILAA